jgi:hypothetical protein
MPPLCREHQNVSLTSRTSFLRDRSALAHVRDLFKRFASNAHNLKFFDSLQDATPDIPQPVRSPDGRLTSEHTRVTLMPLRLSVTQSCQILLGPVDLKGFESPPRMRRRNTGPAAEVKPRQFKFANVPACAMVAHSPTPKSVPQKDNKKMEGSTDDVHLRRMPLVKAGLRQLKNM